MSRIFLVGLPRSGTSWAGRAIGAAAGTRSVGEPDNEDNFAYAIKAKRGLGRYPVVLPGEPIPEPYARLWEGAFAGGGQSPAPAALASTGLHRLAKQRTSVHGSDRWGAARRAMLAASVSLARPPVRAGADHVVVKSVFVPFALRAVCTRWQPRLVVIVRSPLNTVASWQRLGWDLPFDAHPVLGGAGAATVLRALVPGRPLPPPPDPAARLDRLTWELCALMTVLDDAVREHPEALSLRHEELCADPVPAFREVYRTLGLAWTARAEAYLTGANRPGTGTYDTTRVAAEEATRWRGTLSEADAERVLATVAAFGLPW